MTVEDDLIPANSIAFEYVYVSNQRCECGRYFAVQRQELGSTSCGPIDRIIARCEGCQAERTFVFDIGSFFGQFEKYGRFDQTEAHFKQAMAHLRDRRFAEAEMELRQVVDPAEGEPAFAWAHYHLGMLALVQGRADEALSHLERAAAIQPLEAEILEGLARARSMGTR